MVNKNSPKYFKDIFSSITVKSLSILSIQNVLKKVMADYVWQLWCQILMLVDSSGDQMNLKYISQAQQYRNTDTSAIWLNEKEIKFSGLGSLCLGCTITRFKGLFWLVNSIFVIV